jgi:2',3'-cyclic-nucleotide 2'-phosphodiesterase
MQLPPNPPEQDHLRIVLVGDIVGKPGLRAAAAAGMWMRRELKAECLLANAENVADGAGIRAPDYRRLMQAGFHGLTLGDHIYKKKEALELLATATNIVRPCNFPPGSVGKTHMILKVRETVSVAVFSALGRVFMRPVDCPFLAMQRELDTLSSEVKIRIVDFHAEATSDKQVMGRLLDGRVSAVLGTHTHVTTADEQILPGGTGFQCDVGMTGPFESIIGRNIEAVVESTLTALPLPYHVAKEDIRLSATWVDVSIATGRCQRIGRLSLQLPELEEYVASMTPGTLRL